MRVRLWNEKQEGGVEEEDLVYRDLSGNYRYYRNAFPVGQLTEMSCSPQTRFASGRGVQHLD